ncbi:MAG: antitoxin [Gammaproteobacteria bacterium]|nr:antitoxin [Gammaproteobacteria bacterium]
MTKRLQVLFEDDEYQQIQDFAARERMTVAEWVRQALRSARRQHRRDAQAKLGGIREAARNDYPTGDIDQMLEDIARGRDAG